MLVWGNTEMCNLLRPLCYIQHEKTEWKQCVCISLTGSKTWVSYIWLAVLVYTQKIRGSLLWISCTLQIDHKFLSHILNNSVIINEARINKQFKEMALKHNVLVYTYMQVLFWQSLVEARLLLLKISVLLSLQWANPYSFV